jgi:hypothetical protein
MSSTNESNSSNLFKYITIALFALILIGGGTWYITNTNSKQAAIEAALSAAKAEIASQKTKQLADLSKKGQKSAKVYEEYMKQSSSSRIIASTFRQIGENIETHLTKNPQLRSSANFDIRNVVGLGARYYDNAATLASNIDFRDLDPDLIEYINKNREIDLEAKKVYEDYAATGRKPDEYLVLLTNKRNKLIEKNEQALIAKFTNDYGVTLASSEEIRKDAQKNLITESKVFAQTLTPGHVAQQLIGKIFTNAENGQKWKLGASEFFDGTFNMKIAREGAIVVITTLQVKNPRTNNTGALTALAVYAKPADENMLEWPMIFSVNY